jgi:hypothetical protein
MISAHAQALYDRLMKKNKFDGENVMAPSASGKAYKEKDSETERARHSDLAPNISEEHEESEDVSDEPNSLHKLDEGQHSMHSGDQGVDAKANSAHPLLPGAGKKQLHEMSHDHHKMGGEGHPGGSVGDKVHPDHVGDALFNLHYASHPESLGKKLSSAVETARAKREVPLTHKGRR